MYPSTSANEMAQYQQMLYQQQRQQHQSAQHQAARQQQQLLQQQAELRSRELSIQAASNNSQGLSMGHIPQQNSNAGAVSNSSNQFMNHGNSSMYGIPMHHGSSGGSVTSVSAASVPHSSPNLGQHLTGTHSSRTSMAPPSSSSMNRGSSNNAMPPPRSSSSSMLPPSMIPSVRGGIKDRQSELRRKRDEEFLKRKRERENLERTKLEEERYSKALFDAPIKETVQDEDSMQVANILGDHREVHNIINTGTVSCIGIDYQPPTPAAPYQHIIGGEDDEPTNNGNGNLVPDTQSSGMNQIRQHMHPPSSHYRNSFGGPQQINPYMNRPMPRVQNQNPSDIVGSSNHLRVGSSEANSFDNSSRLSQTMPRSTSHHQQQISPEANHNVNNSQQLSPHPPHRRQMPQQRAPSHPIKAQNSNQLTNRQLINSAREMVQHGASPGDSTARQSSHSYQSNHPLENMLRLSNTTSPLAHPKDSSSSSSAENQFRGSNIPSSQGTSAISPLSKHMSSNPNYGLKVHQNSSASIGSSYNSNKMKQNNGLPPLNMEAAKEESRKQENVISKQGLQAIFNEMAVCPPPLSAIETPRISDHEGNNSKNLAPKYSFMSLPEPLTPISSHSGHDDIPNNTSSVAQNNQFKDSLSVANPNLSEDSDSDQANFESSKKGSSHVQQKSNSYSNGDSMQSITQSSKHALSENTSNLSSDKETFLQGTEIPSVSKTSKSSTSGTHGNLPISTNANSLDNSTTSAKGVTEQSRHLSQTTERGASSSDSTSASDSSDSESSSEEEDNAKDNSGKKPRNSESSAINSRSPKTCTSNANKMPNDESKVTSTIPRNVMSGTSPFDTNSTNLTNFDPSTNMSNLDASEQEPEDVDNEEVYGLGSFYKKVIKSTHSPHSQPSPKISQGSDSVHGGNRSFKADLGDSPSNTTDILDRQDEDDPMFGMLSNSNQQLPDYSDLIPNSSKSNSAGGMKESSHKKKSYKTLPPVSKEKKSLDPLISNNSQVFPNRTYQEDNKSSGSSKKKGKRKRSHDHEDNKMRENDSLATSENESSSKVSYSSSGSRNRPTPKKFATPTLKLEDKTADEELGEDLMEIQSPSYSHKSAKRSQNSVNHRKKDNYVSPSRRNAHYNLQPAINSNTAKLPTSPYKNFANKRGKTLQDPSLSVSSSSEEDDKTDEDWKETERGPKRQKMLPKASRQVKTGNKTSPRKVCDIPKSSISDKEFSNQSVDESEFESTPRPAKGKGGKNGAGSDVKKTNVIGNIFAKRAIQQKKNVEIPNEKDSKKCENRSYDLSSERQSLESGKERQYHCPDAPDDSRETAKLYYRSTQEHPEIQRPKVFCRIPLGSLKSSQRLNSIIDLRQSSFDVKPSKQIDSRASLVSSNTKHSNQHKNNHENSAISVRDSSSERSSSKKKRDRSRRDSSASSNVSLKSSKHARKKRNQRLTTKGFSDSSSDSDHVGSVHSSTSNSHNKRRRKDQSIKDIEAKSISNNQNPTASEPRSSSSLSNRERFKDLDDEHLTSTNFSPHNQLTSRLHGEEEKQTSSYQEEQYYGYNEDNQESHLQNPARSPNSVENPTPSTSNGVKDTQSHQTRMMPPPDKKMFYSYVEQRKAEEEQLEDSEIDPTDYMVQGKGLKHEADKEPDRERQAMKYLQAVLYFILYAHANEQRNEKQGAFTIYQETLNLVKHVCRPFKNSEFGNFDNKLAVISLRCQSLLFLKLYKMRRHELKECQKIIGDHIQKASNASQSSVNQGSNDSTSPNNVAGNGTTISPTPSPAGSEGSVCSKSSGYTSAGETNIPPGGGSTSLSYGRSTYGVLTPPTNGAAGYSLGQNANAATGATIQHLSVPSQVMEKQYQFCSYLSQCHELWELADLYTYRGHCKDFIIRLDQTCGPLTLHSSLKELVRYTQEGLDFLSKEIKDDEMQ